MTNLNFDEMAAVLLEQFEMWISCQPNRDQLLEAMDVIEEAMSREHSLAVKECLVVSDAALVLARAASCVEGFEALVVMYQTVAGLFRVAGAGK